MPCFQMSNLFPLSSPKPQSSFQNCCTNDLSIEMMKNSNNLSLQTFAMIEVHKNIPKWSNHLSMTTTQFILNLCIPKRLITRLYIHYICCDLHNETAHNKKALYLYAPSVPHILSKITTYLKLPPYNYDSFPFKILFPKTVITYSCMYLLLELDENWMVDVVINRSFDSLHLQNYLHKNFFVKCITEPDIHIRQPLFLHLDYVNNELVCTQNSYKFSSINPSSVGKLIYLCA